VIESIDNRRLARVAKLAGAPEDKAAGLEIHVRVGELAIEDQPHYTIHAESSGELSYALEYARANSGIVAIVRS
ncbi:MAG TPA: thymidine phosphorylase, partial [Steroidobacteraceae bacterium]|nr:thymidine phosphorylase [Steroidobacteraceae bacterium]